MIFQNRIQKNYKHISKWAKRTNTNAFRIYDWDIGAYPYAIDYYAGKFAVHYFSKYGEEANVEEVEEVLKALFGEVEIFWRERIKRDKYQQYEKRGEGGDFFEVLEYGVKFWVNLTDYLDSGLFLDHRETRRYVASICKGKRMLNLFAYTCAFSVHAAYQGASFTKSVDMSNTYTEWGRRNFALNGLSGCVVREDCMKFLKEEKSEYDVIVIDPPTISRSKKMEGMFDVQVDYPFLIESGLRLLAQDGVIFFSTNSRRFVFDETLFSNAKIYEVSEKTIPLDFHNKNIHRCWKITKKTV